MLSCSCRWVHYYHVTISRSRCCYKTVSSFLPCTAMSLSRPWQEFFACAECLLSLTCDLNGFKLIDTSFLWAFSKQLCYISFLSFSSLLFLASPCLIGCSACCWSKIKPIFFEKSFIKNYLPFTIFLIS